MLPSNALDLVAPLERFPLRLLSLVLSGLAAAVELRLTPFPVLLLSLTHKGLTATFQDAEASPCQEHFSLTLEACICFDAHLLQLDPKIKCWES